MVMPCITLLSVTHVWLMVKTMVQACIETMYASMYHQIVPCKPRMDGGNVAQAQPLGVRYGLVSSTSPMVKPLALLSTGWYPRLLKKINTAGITSILFKSRLAFNGD